MNTPSRRTFLKNLAAGAAVLSLPRLEADVRRFPPAKPGKILGIVENHPRADGTAPAGDPAALRKLGRLFGKFPTAFAGPGDAIMRPPEARSLRVDGQLVIVIGRQARHVPAAEALDYVAGYTLGADVSEADWYRTARLVGRSTDTWAPVGPAVVPGIDPREIVVETRVNGRLVERLATRDLVVGIPELVSFFSRYNTLEPGDLIFTGSRTGAQPPERPLQSGDVIEVSGGPLGTLRNHVADLPPEPDWAVPATAAPVGPPEQWVRYATPGGPRHGRLSPAGIEELTGDLLAPPVPSGRVIPLPGTPLLPPVRPPKIIGVILNYFPPGSTDRPAPLAELPARLFLKWPQALGTTGSAIELPPEAANLNWEGELVAVIGRTARHVTPAQALGHVRGYAVGNDVSENNWGGLVGKAADSWSQLGPVLTTGVAWDRLHVETRHNGVLVQSQATADLRYGIPLLVAYASRYFTLEPGDLIYSGSAHRIPGTPRRMQPGDEIVVTIEGLGALRNTVVPMPMPASR